MTKKASRSLANPTLLKPVDKHDGMLQVIIETPKGSRNKFAYDDKQNIFALKAVLPAGMTFPHDFGFLPKTLAPDGDPIDVLLLMDEPAFPGVAVRARLIGIIEGEQIDGKKRSATIVSSPSRRQITSTPTSSACRTCPADFFTSLKISLSITTSSKERNTGCLGVKMPRLRSA